MGAEDRHFAVTLDAIHASKLRYLAERVRAGESALASSLLATALDEADPDPRPTAVLLDGIPGAFERAALGCEQARDGLGAPLEEL